MRWTTSQYREAWDNTYSQCDSDMQDTLDRKLDLLQQYGNLCGRPTTAPLGDGIFELRAKDARMLFYFGEQREIVFVHGLIKKTRNVPRADIDRAKKNRTENQLSRKNKRRKNDYVN